MAELDLSFCSLAEYTVNEPNRIFEHELAVDSLYSIMYALKKGPYEAAITPARIVENAEQPRGRCIRFATLNEDLQVSAYIHSDFSNGYMDTMKTTTYVSGQLVEGAYFKPYEDGTRWNPVELVEMLELAVTL